MWCKCKILEGVNIGCLNIPYNNTQLGTFYIRVKKDGEYIDFVSPSIEDVFLLIKTVDDNRASVYEKLSLSNGGLVIDIDDSTRFVVSTTTKMLNKSNNKLYYQMFIKEDGNSYPIMKGGFIYQQNYN